MKPIPDAILEDALSRAILPVKQFDELTLHIYQSVADLMTARQAGNDPTKEWDDLKRVLDQAVKDNEWEAFSDLAKAWNKLKIETSSFTNNGVKSTHGKVMNPPRAPVTAALIRAIMYLQESKWVAYRISEDEFEFIYEGYVTRKEILDEMAIDGMAIDESELSRQLTRLEWNNLI